MNFFTPRISFILFLLIAPFLTGTALGQLRQVYAGTGDADNDIRKISFYTPSEGYVAFRDWIGYTQDSGRTFVKKYVQLDNVDYNGYGVNLTFGFGIKGVKAFSRDVLVAYGDYGLVPAILYSGNGGSSFKLVYHSQFNSMQLRTGITDMVFPGNGTTGFATDADRILKTTDRGLSWSPVYTASGSYFDYLEAVDNANVWAFSTGYTTSKLLKTSNGGTSWSAVALPAGQVVNYAHFLTASKGFINTNNDSERGRTYYTSNGGASWELKSLPGITLFEAEKMRFVNDSTGYALGELFDTYKTTDSGKIWERLPRDNGFTYLGYSHDDLQLWNSSQLWVGGGMGFLELSTNGGGAPVPRAFFRIDTAGVYRSGTVMLVNYSKPAYQYKWLVNRVEVGTSYHAAYPHDPFRLTDTVQLVVTNSGGAADTLESVQRFYPPVVVASFLPTSAATGTVVTITGQNFTGATNVFFGDREASFTVVNATTIRATVGAGSSGAVTVFTPTGRGSLAGFTYLPPPAVTTFSPLSAEAGTTVTITGEYFNNVTAVHFGNHPAAAFTVVSPTTITAVVGAGASGNVKVTTNAGIGSAPGFVMLPALHAFTPTSGTFGTYMTITGTGFGGATAVSIGGVAAQSFTVNSYTSITAVVHTGSSGEVRVTTPGGSAAKPGFTWFPPPTITSFTPAAGPVGTRVTISGTNFDANPTANTVYFGAVKATVVEGTTASLTVTVPAGASYQPLSVTANSLTAYSNKPFEVTFPGGGSITANSFASRTEQGTGTDYYPVRAAMGDMDGDGKADVVVANRTTYVINNAISILRNTSTADALSFEPKVDLLVRDPSSYILSDLDGDGRLDVAISDRDASTLLLYRNTSASGALSFATPVTMALSGMAGYLAAEDLDGDGKPDVVLSSATDASLVVLRNISNPGSLTLAAPVKFANNAGRNVVISDMDGDGRHDLALCLGGQVSVLRNTSTRGVLSFAAPYSVAGALWTAVAAGDVDGDGKADLVATGTLDSRVAVFRNTGAVANVAFQAPLELMTPSTPRGVELSDMDGDGKTDIAVTTFTYGLSVYKNTSVAGTPSFGEGVSYHPGRYTGESNMGLGDVNGDGRPDALLAAEMSRTLAIYLNGVKAEPYIESFTPTIGVAGTEVTLTGNNFTGATEVSFGGTPAASFTVLSNTRLTAVVGSGTAGSVTVTNTVGADARPGFAYGYPPVITGVAPQAAGIGSTVTIVGNGFSAVAADNTVYFGGVQARVEAATATALQVNVPSGATHLPLTVTTNKLTGFSARPFVTTFPDAGYPFTASSFTPWPVLTGRGGGRGVLGDLDGDGKLDMVVIYGTNSFAVSRNLSEGSDLVLAPAQAFAAGDDVSSFALGDLDGDGRLDVVTTNYEGQSISVLRNTSTPGAVSFAPAQTLLSGLSTTRPEGVVIIDLDGDGKPDIAGANYYSQSLAVFRNQSTPGTIQLGALDEYMLDGLPTDLQATDIDGDGKVDLVAPVNSCQCVTVLRNTSIPGAIRLARPVSFPVGQWPNNMAVGDLDGDGRSDLAVPNLNGYSFSLLRNNSTPGTVSFAPRIDYPLEYRSRQISLCDYDGDAKLDLVTNREGSFYSTPTNNVLVYKNSSTPGMLTLSTPAEYKVDADPLFTTAGDLNNDGRPDMAVFSQGGAITVFQNKGGSRVTVSVCAQANASITSNRTGTIYRWQQNTGAGFSDLTDNASFAGTGSPELELKNVPLSWKGQEYRCLVDGEPSRTFVLEVNSLPEADAGPDKSVCTPGTYTWIGGATIEGNKYAWTPTTYINSSNVAMTGVYPNATTTYTVTVTNRLGCTAKDTVVVTVGSLAAPQVTYQGSTTLCRNSLLIFTSSASWGNQWYKDGYALPDATGQTYTATTYGSYTVKVTQNGCTSPASTPVQLQLSTLAAPVVTASGPTRLCPGTQVTLTASATSGVQWYRNGFLVIGASTPTYTVTEAGTYTATTAVNDCTSNPSNAVSVTFDAPVGAPTVSALGPTSVCSGNSVLLTSSAPAGNQWYRNGTVLSGAVGAQYNAIQSGQYSVTATGSCVSGTSAPMDIQVTPRPDTPVITAVANLLSSSAASGNQWYLNGVAISGATDRQYTATASGSYTVRVAVNGCSNTSQPFNYVATAIVDPTAWNGEVVAYPNPVAQKLWIRNDKARRLHLLLLDAYGRKVYEGSLSATVGTIDLQGLGSGVYHLLITDTRKQESITQTVIKL